MSRHVRRTTALEAVAILEGGGYRAPSARTVSIAGGLARAVENTVLYRPGELDELLERVLAAEPGADTRVEVTGETTLAAARRLCGPGAVPFALNFASAKNPEIGRAHV